jgi:hypothetical protein
MSSAVLLIALGALDVQWLAPESCPAPELSRLAGASGRAVARVDTNTPGTWRLELTFVEPFTGTRTLELSSCADARRVARALLVLGLQGAEAFQSSEVATSPTPVVATEPPAPTVAPPVAGLSITPRLGGAFSFGSAPLGSGRFVAGADLRVRFFEAGLLARVGLPLRFDTPSGAKVALWPTLGGDLTACWAPRSGRFTFGACASLVAEWWQLEGSGVTDPGRGSAAYVSAGPLARATWRFGPAFEVGGSLAFRAAIRRPTAVLDGREALSAGPVALEAQAFVGCVFGGATP